MLNSVVMNDTRVAIESFSSPVGSRSVVYRLLDEDPTALMTSSTLTSSKVDNSGHGLSECEGRSADAVDARTSPTFLSMKS